MQSSVQRQRLNTAQAATYIGDDISPRTLEGWRITGGGPVFMRVGRRVVYDVLDIDAWLATRRRHSTTVSAAALAA